MEKNRIPLVLRWLQEDGLYMIQHKTCQYQLNILHSFQAEFSWQSEFWLDQHFLSWDCCISNLLQGIKRKSDSSSFKNTASGRGGSSANFLFQMKVWSARGATHLIERPRFSWEGQEICWAILLPAHEPGSHELLKHSRNIRCLEEMYLLLQYGTNQHKWKEWGFYH